MRGKLTRRSFLESLGLGAGAMVLGPIAGGLFNRAMGQVSNRQRVIIAVMGESMDQYIPSQFANVGADAEVALTTNFTWPDLLKNFLPFKNNALILDRLQIDRRGGGNSVHNLYHGVLQGFSKDAQVNDVPNAEGITIDQAWAKGAMGEGVSHRSVNFGLKRQYKYGDAAVYDESISTFAYGAQSPLKHILRATVLEKRLFGAGIGAGAAPDTSSRRKRIMEHLNKDITRLQNRLAGEEKAKLDEYLTAIERYDEKRRIQDSITCTRPATPTYTTPDRNLADMCDMTALAMKCGMTNIAGITVANDDGHGAFPDFEFFKAAPFNIESWPNAHSSNEPWVDQVHPAVVHFYTAQIVRMLETLSGQPGVMPENTTVVMVSSNGKRYQSYLHHGLNWWVPAFILSSNPKLKTGGNFRMYKRDAVQMGALYVTLSQAFGVPMSDFGYWTKGPLQELLV